MNPCAGPSRYRYRTAGIYDHGYRNTWIQVPCVGVCGYGYECDANPGIIYDCTHGYGTSVFAREYGYDWNPCTSTDPASVSVKYEKSEASSAPSARQTRLKRLVSPVTSDNKCTLSRTQRLRTERAFKAQWKRVHANVVIRRLATEKVRKLNS